MILKCQPISWKFLGKELFSVFVIILLFFLFLGRLFDGTRSFAQFQDNTYMLLPIFSYVSRVFESGGFPYWINSIVGGLPLYNAAQFSTLYPFYFFGSGLFQTPYDAMVQVHFITLLHVLILIINTYILGRIIGLNRTAAIFSSFLFSLSPNFFSYMPWVNMAPYSWFPLAVGAIILILRQDFRRAGISLGVLSISLLIFASASQALIHLFYFCLVLYFAEVYKLYYQRNYSLIKKISIDLSIMSILCLLIVSPVLVPTVVDMTSMIRWIGDFPPIIGNDKIPFKAFLIGQLKLSELGSVLLPQSGHFIVGHPYLGMSACFLALVSFLFRNRNPYIKLFMVVGIFGLLSSVGSNLGLAYLNHILPLLNKLREPARNLFYFTFCFSFLAGFGLQFLLKEIETIGFKKIKSAFVRVCGLFFVLTLLSLYFAKDSSKGVLAIELGSFLGLVILLAISNIKLKPTISMILIGGLVVITNFSQFPWTANKISDGDYMLPQNLLSHQVLKEVATIPDIRNFRVIFEDNELNAQQWAMNASYYGLRTFNAYFNPLPYGLFTDMYYHGSSYSNYFESLGAKYALCKKCNNKDLLKYKLIKNINGINLYQNSQALPHYFATNMVEGLFDSGEDFFRKIGGVEKMDKTVFLDRNLYQQRILKFSQMQESDVILSLVSESYNKFVFNIKSKADSLVVLNEHFNTNWQVQVNGQVAEPIRVNLNQIGAHVGPGENIVSFEYRPKLFIGLLWVSRMTSFFILLFGMFVIFIQLKSYCSNRKNKAHSTSI